MRDDLEKLLREADVPSPERAELLWAEYRTGRPGAEAAFGTLLAWYGLAVYRRIWGFVRSDAAEDVFQDVLTKLHRQRHKLATFEHALRWLRTVAVRECVDAHRRTTRRRRREAKRAVSPDAHTLPDPRGELQEAIATGLAKLPARQREAVALVYFEELNRAAAAAVIGVHRDTLAKLLDDALVKLRGLLPAPVVLAAGGTLAVQTILSAKPPPPAPGRLGELIGAVWAKTVVSGRSFGKLAAPLAVGLVVAGGMAAAGWGMVRDPAPAPSLKGPAAVLPIAPTPVESVPARNLRVFRAGVLPAQLAALRGLVIGDGGEVTLESAEAYDVRVRCIFKLRHKSPDLPGWVSELELIHTTWDIHSGKRFTGIYFDVFGRGERRAIDVKRPIVLWRNPLTGREVVVKSAPLEAVVAAFDQLPHDALSDAELRSTRALLEAAAAPLLGVWYAHGDPTRRCEVRLTPAGRLEFVPAEGRLESVSLMGLRVDPAGRFQSLAVAQDPVTLSADGRRIELPAFRDWWSREPIPGVGE